MQQVYLTRRNLTVLLAKLDRNRHDGAGSSACSIIKQDTVHPKYPCSDVIQVTAIENEDYYTDRQAGHMHPAEDKLERSPD